MTFRELALSFPNSIEQAHFNKTSFRVNKKIFATLNKNESEVVLKLSLIDQDVFNKMSSGIFSPVANKWGRHGWTVVELKNVDMDMLKDGLKCAYDEVLKAK